MNLWQRLKRHECKNGHYHFDHRNVKLCNDYNVRFSIIRASKDPLYEIKMKLAKGEISIKEFDELRVVING